MEKTIYRKFYNYLAKRRPKEHAFSIKDELFNALSSIPILWQVLFFYVPTILLIARSFINVTYLNFFNIITVSHFASALNITYLSVILNSINLSVTTTGLCLLIGFPIAYCMSYGARRIKKLLLLLLVIPFWTNFILYVYSWCFILEKHGLINGLLTTMGILNAPVHLLNSYFAILLMMVYFYLPFMVIPIYLSIEKFDKSLLEASLDLGASKIKTLRKILIPMSENAIKLGIKLVFIPSFGEFIIPEFMGGDKFCFIGNAIATLILGETTVPLGMAFTVICVLVLIVLMILIDKLISYVIKLLKGGTIRC